MAKSSQHLKRRQRERIANKHKRQRNKETGAKSVGRWIWKNKGILFSTGKDLYFNWELIQTHVFALCEIVHPCLIQLGVELGPWNLLFWQIFKELWGKGAE
ncbi:MAG: hypothetical protein AVDCRST_MAG56-934 [uncultured Cytophagales bacterium]|uniref:Uncharacterized protein n=1 Tax=uncultured Cytophagales bacterium TaxID=158755 RepID=A0A6J4HPP2_9SPHI|nr:MAG: hypothetical protein AVDCRST_MAG56-934 [uncultured Cytophagales bacterium]